MTYATHDPFRERDKVLLVLGMLAALTLLAAMVCGCGVGGEKNQHRVTVDEYVQADDQHLGFTYGPISNDGYFCLINDVLLVDDDPDRLVRVIVHELLGTLVLRDGGYPVEYAADWYLAESDARPPLYPIPVEEAAWAAGHEPMEVEVVPDWLEAPTNAAIQRINDASGVIVFQRP